MKFLSLFVFISLNASASQNLTVLAVGESQDIKVPSKSHIRVSNGKVVRVQDQGDRLLLSGRKKGTAVLSHSQGAVRIEVVDPSVVRTYALFTELLKKMMGLHLDVSDNQVIVRGELLRMKDWQALIQAQSQTGGNWLMQASLNQALRDPAKQMIHAALALNSGHSARIALVPFPRVLASLVQAPNFEKDSRLRNLGLTVSGQTDLLDLQPSIRLNLTLAEIQNGTGERLGLGFHDGQTVQLSPVFKAPKEFAATLGFMKEKGWAKILSTPSLVARNGSEAEFLNGGEFAVRSARKRVQETTWKRHGLWLKFKPSLDPRGIVRLEVETEFSAPDYSNQVDGVPSVRSSKARSAIDMQLGATVLLSGLLHENKGWAASGPAGLADLPVLGRLFRSRDFLESRSRLQIFITPELVPVEINEPLQNETEEKWNWSN